MKPSVLLIQIALVGAGILIYDLARSETATRPVVDPSLAPIRMEVPRETDEPSAPPIVLEGGAVEALRARVVELERWKRDAERRLAERPAAAEPAGTDPAPGAPYEPPAYGGEETEPASVRQEDVSWFRRVKQEVDRMEREERYTEMIGRQLDRLGVSLSDESRDRLVKLTVSFRDRVREAIQASAAAQEEPGDRQARLETLRREYEQSVYNLVPAGEAEKIVESMGRYPGFGFRQDGRTRGGR